MSWMDWAFSAFEERGSKLSGGISSSRESKDSVCDVAEEEDDAVSDGDGGAVGDTSTKGCRYGVLQVEIAFWSKTRFALRKTKKAVKIFFVNCAIKFGGL